jgi:hypothetical protein
MPEISRFFGIIIKMYYNEHNPPHFHAHYNEFKAVFSIASGQIIEGDFPSKKATLVSAWSILHQDELLKNWENLVAEIGFDKIEPLR